MRRFGFVIALTAVLDGVLSTLLFSEFSFQRAKLNISLLLNYSFSACLIDIWLIGNVRVWILLGLALGILWRPSVAVRRFPGYSYFLAAFAVLSTLFLLVKLLVTTENSSLIDNDLYYWLQVSWALAATLSCFLVTYLLRKFGTISQSIVNRLSNNSESREALVNDIESSTETTRRTGVLRLLRFSKPDAHLILIAFLALIAAAVSDVLAPNYIGEVIAGIVITRSTSEFIRAIVLYAVVSGASLLATGVRGGLFTLCLARLSKRVRGMLFENILKQEAAFFDKTRTGDIMSRLSSDVSTMTDTLSLNVNIFLRNLVKAVGISIMMFSLSWRLSLITIAGLPLIAFANHFFGAIYEKLSEAVQNAISKTSQVAEEAISNFKTILSLAGENVELERYEKDLFSAYKLQVRESLIYAVSIWTCDALSLGLTISTLYYGGHLVITEQLDSKYLVTFLIYQITLGDCLQSMGSVYTGLMQALGASRKVIEYLDRIPEQVRSGPLKPSFAKGRIEFRNVSFSYPTRKDAPILQNISFTVNPGEVVALVGKSGSGKSSCLALLERFYDPICGEILFDDVQVGNYDHSWLHRTIAMVSQEPILFARSIKENILFAAEIEDAGNEVLKAAKMADAEDFIDHLPDKYNTECGEKGTQMSGGQKQRIAIARALIRKPNVLLLDEATSALDATAEAAVQETLSRAMAGRTVLVVAHRLSTIRNADRILVMEHGKIVEHGKHSDLLGMNGSYADLVKKQLSFGKESSDEESVSLSCYKSLEQSLSKSEPMAEGLLLSTSPYFRHYNSAVGSLEPEKKPLF